MQVGALQVMLHPKKGQTPDDCRRQAEGGGGASAYDEFGEACWKVYGKAVKIQEDQNSIMEGFIITNVNFNTQSSQGALPKSGDLPGGYTESNHGNSNGSQQLSPSGGRFGAQYGFST